MSSPEGAPGRAWVRDGRFRQRSPQSEDTMSRHRQWHPGASHFPSRRKAGDTCAWPDLDQAHWPWRLQPRCPRTGWPWKGDSTALQGLSFCKFSHWTTSLDLGLAETTAPSLHPAKG